MRRRGDGVEEVDELDGIVIDEDEFELSKLLWLVVVCIGKMGGGGGGDGDTPGM